MGVARGVQDSGCGSGECKIVGVARVSDTLDWANMVYHVLAVIALLRVHLHEKGPTGHAYYSEASLIRHSMVKEVFD